MGVERGDTVAAYGEVLTVAAYGEAPAPKYGKKGDMSPSLSLMRPDVHGLCPFPEWGH